MPSWSLIPLVVSAAFVVAAAGPAIPISEAKSVVTSGEGARHAEDLRLARAIMKAVLSPLRREGDDSSATETIAAMAAVVGERCIDAAGEFPTRRHKFVPGQRVFSDKINVLLSGDINTDDISALPVESVFGTLRAELAGSQFSPDRYPGISEVFRGFAARIGKPEDWGKVPLSLPPEQWPRRLPLLSAFEARPGVDAAVQAIKNDKARCLHVCALAMALLLRNVGDRIDPGIALRLTLETINGMAKTAPLTDKAINDPPPAMREAQHQVVKVGGR